MANTTINPNNNTNLPKGESVLKKAILFIKIIFVKLVYKINIFAVVN